MSLQFLDIAFKEAEKARALKEVPVGAVIVDFKSKLIVAKAHNKCLEMANMLMHAEMLAINEASKHYKNGFLNNCDIYITLEPCNMCYHALWLARIRRIYFACSRDLIKCSNFAIHEKLEIYQGFSEEKGKMLLQDFFQDLRTRKNTNDCSF